MKEDLYYKRFSTWMWLLNELLNSWEVGMLVKMLQLQEVKYNNVWLVLNVVMLVLLIMIITRWLLLLIDLRKLNRLIPLWRKMASMQQLMVTLEVEDLFPLRKFSPSCESKDKFLCLEESSTELGTRAEEDNF